MKEKVPIQCLTKPVSADCNLRCTYCFYLPKTALYPETKVHRMPDHVLECLVRRGLEQDSPNAIFGFQGGEPTLAGLEFFQKLVEYQKKQGRTGKTVSNSLQTNGYVIDEEWAAFLHEYHFLVGLSIDGPKEMHDVYRHTISGSGTWDRVMKTTAIFRQYKVEFNILVLLNDINVKHPKEVYRFFIDNGFTWLQFVPCIEMNPVTGEIEPFSITGKEYGMFLCEVFDEWYEKHREKVYIRIFEDVLHQYCGIESPSCIFHRNCGEYLLIEHNGDAYPCDFFVEKGLLLGNILDHTLEELINSEKMREFGKQKAFLHSSCKMCRFLHFCYGACLKERVHIIDNMPVNHLCEGYKMFFEHTEDRFKKLAREVMQRQGMR